MLILNIFEKGFSIISILFFSDAFFPLLFEQGVSWAGPLKNLLGLLIIALSLVFLCINWRKVFPIIVKEKLLWILFAIALVSIFWSDSPGASFRGELVLIRATIFGTYFAIRYDSEEQLNILSWAFGLAALFSYVFAMTLPIFGVMGVGTPNSEHLAHMGSWRGIYTHKNLLGRTMALGSMIFALSAMSSKKHNKLGIIGIIGCGLCVLLVLLSTSKTALAILIFTLILLPFYRALRWNYSALVPVMIFGIIIVGGLFVFFLSYVDEILGGMGRDMTLTGRTDIWSAIWHKIQERWWLGYGYDGFWRGWYSPAEDVWLAVKFQPPHGHNGFLDLWLDLGFLGLFVFLCSYFTGYIRAIGWFRLMRTYTSLLPITFLTYMLFYNITESSIFEQSLFWILYLVVTLSMHNIASNKYSMNKSQNVQNYQDLLMKV
jgi:exopolysaccharide production protein ExoQ